MSSTRGRRAITTIATITTITAWGLAAAPAAWAQQAADVDVLLQVKTPDAKAPGTRGDAPRIEATVLDAPTVAADRFVLVDESARPPIRIPAASRRTFSQGPDPMAIAIVMNGWEMWIGNDTYRPRSDSTRERGALAAVQAAIDKVNLKAFAPQGSVGAVITYADSARIRVPMGPIANLTGRALGSQKDYRDTVGVELVKGVGLALAELHKVSQPIKLLIVLGDGNDTNSDTARTAFAALRKQALTDRVQIVAIVYRSSLSETNNFLTHLTPQISTVTTADNIGASLKTALEWLASRRQYLTFPGASADGKTALAWDGKPHDLVLEINGQKTPMQTVMLEPRWQPPAPPRPPAPAPARPPAPAPAKR